MTDVGSQGIRGKRKSTYMSGAVALLIVATMLAISSFVIGTAAMLWVALALAGVAALLVLIGRRVRKTAPSHADHPAMTHDEDHPKERRTR